MYDTLNICPENTKNPKLIKSQIYVMRLLPMMCEENPKICDENPNNDV